MPAEESNTRGETDASAQPNGRTDALSRLIPWKYSGPEDYAALVMFVVLAGGVFAQFVSRYVLNQSIAWTEELARFLLVVTVFVASIGAVRRGTHIAVRLLDDRLGPSLRRALGLLTGTVAAVFFMAAAWLSVEIAQRAWGQTMSTMPISRGWLYSIVAVSFAAMAARVVQAMVLQLCQSDDT